MNKKLIRILMIAAIAVGVGTFVSCKDTNADLANELREQGVTDNTTLKNALEQQKQLMQSQIDALNQTIAQIKQCQCNDDTNPNSLANQLATLTAQYNALNDKISKADATGKTELQKEVETFIQNNINNFPVGAGQGGSQITINQMYQNQVSDEAAIKLLEEAVKDLTTQLNGIKSCSCSGSGCTCDPSSGKCNCDGTGKCSCDFSTQWATLNDLATRMPLVESLASEAKTLALANQTAINTNTTNITNLTNSFNTLSTNFNTLDDLVKNTLSPKLDNAVNNASDALAKATANETYINSIKDKLPEAFTNITNLQTAVTNLQTTCQQIGINTTAISDLKTRVETLEGDMTTYKGKVDALETEVGNIKTLCETNLTAAKNYADEVVKTAKTEILASVAEDLKGYYTKAEIDEKLKDINIEIGKKADQTVVDAINTEIEEIKKKLCQCEPIDLTDLTSRLTTAEGNISNNTAAINDIKDNLLKTINDNITTLTNDLSTTNTNLTNLTTTVNNLNYITPEKVQELIDIVVAKAKADSTLLANKELADSAAFKKRMDIIGDSVAKNFASIVDLTTRVTTLENTTVKIADYEIDKADILGKINANTTSIGELQTKVTDIESEITTIKSDITALDTRLTDAENLIAEMQEDITEIRNDVDSLQELLAKQVTSIIIQGTKNPMFGTFNMPFDIQSNVLMAFYGIPADDIEFPTYKTANYINADEALTAKDMAMLSGVQKFNWYANVPLMLEGSDEYKGYAGKVFMTINPNTADLDGLKLDIVNSQDEVSPITLTPIQKSETKLEFGYSRANNGFYEANAEIDLGDIENVQKLSFNTAAIKDAVTEIANKRTGADMNKIASDMYEVVKAMRMERDGLKCTYTENGNEHSVYSQYNLAAAAFKPLSLGTLKDLNVKTIPGLNRAENLIDRLSKRIKDTIHKGTKEVTGSTLAKMMADLKIKDIEVKDLTEDKLAHFIVHLDTTVVINGLSYHLTSLDNVTVPVKFDFDDKAHVKFDGEASLLIKDGSVIKTPVVNLSPDLKAEGGSGKILIPLKDAEGNLVYNSGGEQQFLEYDLSNIEFDYSNVTTDSHGNKVVELKVEGNTVGHISYEDDVDIKFSVDTKIENITINVDKWFYFGDNGTDTKSINLKMTYDMRDAAKDLWGEAQSALGSVNDMLDDIRDIVKEANKLIGKVNDYEDRIDNNIDNYTDKIKNYLEKINTKVTSLINSANSRLQPVLIASTGKGIKRLSGAKNYPTVLSSDVTLYPTSWTMELLTPFARKHVAVTNVFKGTESAQGGNSDCVARLKAANSGEMNQVINGDDREVVVNGLVPGYVYEIAYSALDFHGNIATRKYYISVK